MKQKKSSPKKQSIPTPKPPAAAIPEAPPSFFRQHLPFILFFAALLIAGIAMHKDYGLSWDETLTRQDNGLVNYNYIHTGDITPLDTNRERYHGPVFEIGLVMLEKGMHLEDSRDIFFMRHMVNFLVFALAVFFFYLLCLRTFRNSHVALLGCAFLVLSPRIFADAFYNSKDLVFLCLFIIAMYSFVVFVEKKNWVTALWHALACALLIDVRILGIMIPVITLGYIGYDLYNVQAQARTKQALSAVIYMVAMIAIIILCWPVLWRNPMHNFSEALKEMSRYPWPGQVLYDGKFIPATELPWHYIPRWLMITTPVLYIVLFFSGIPVILYSFVRSSDTKLKRIFLFVIYCFFAPLLSTIMMGSVVYDGWRHLFFVYPAFLMIGLAAFEFIYAWLKSKPALRTGFIAVVVLLLGVTAWNMADLHPYENVYFNSFAGGSMREIKKKYEMDYWGLSYRKGLEYIVQHDTASVIKVIATNYPGKTNAQMLPPEDRKRLQFLNTSNGADYLIANFRFHPDEYEVGTEVFSIKAGNAKILIVNSLKK